MKTSLKSGTAIKVGVIVLVAVIALAVPALSVAADSATVTIKNSKAGQATVLKYWTRERIAAAPAMQLPVDFGSPGVNATALARESAASSGAGASSPPGKADPNEEQKARTAYAADWAAIEREAAVMAAAYTAESSDTAGNDDSADLEAGTASVFTYYNVGTIAEFYNIYPHKWVGRLTATTPSGTIGCSAAVISGNNIVTAAHCVYDTVANQWYTNFSFSPAFRNGTTPYGTFPWQQAWVTTRYVNLSGGFDINTWTRHDVAIIKLGTNSSGQTINSVVGWAGRYWNAGYEQQVFNSGYPAQIYTDAYIGNGPAQYLRACAAESFLQTTNTMGSGCYWGRGMSGGPWLISYKPFVLDGYIYSVNSGLYIGIPNLYGARFNTNNIVTLCSAAGC